MDLNGFERIRMDFNHVVYWLEWTLATQQFGDLYHKTWDWWIFARSNHHHGDLHSSNKEIQQGNARRLTTLRNHGSVEVHGSLMTSLQIGSLAGGILISWELDLGASWLTPVLCVHEQKCEMLNRRVTHGIMWITPMEHAIIYAVLDHSQNISISKNERCIAKVHKSQSRRLTRHSRIRSWCWILLPEDHSGWR